MVQHGGVVEHKVHDLMTEQPAELQYKNNNKINYPLTSVLLTGLFINLSLTVQAAFLIS
jgi:hypothetical protein